MMLKLNAGTDKFEIDKLTQITDKFFDHCLDHPKDNALAAFEKMARQARRRASESVRS